MFIELPDRHPLVEHRRARGRALFTRRQRDRDCHHQRAADRDDRAATPRLAPRKREHAAAEESHVDRSLIEAGTFIETDVHGVLVLLEEARKHAPKLRRFIQISTDEVYGSIAEGSFTESDALNPRNPYSASKAGGDRMAFAYGQTYGLPVIVTRASNNFGPYQYPEKLIPLFVTNAIDNLPLPLYGDGRNVRDWLFVDDHCAAIDFLIDHGSNSETYNIGGGNERENREITQKILQILGKPQSLIKPVADRQGHDGRYSISSRTLEDLGFQFSR